MTTAKILAVAIRPLGTIGSYLFALFNQERFTIDIFKPSDEIAFIFSSIFLSNGGNGNKKIL